LSYLCCSTVFQRLNKVYSAALVFQASCWPYIAHCRHVHGEHGTWNRGAVISSCVTRSVCAFLAVQRDMRHGTSFFRGACPCEILQESPCLAACRTFAHAPLKRSRDGERNHLETGRESSRVEVNERAPARERAQGAAAEQALYSSQQLFTIISVVDAPCAKRAREVIAE
jgi:hypothetical protein